MTKDTPLHGTSKSRTALNWFSVAGRLFPNWRQRFRARREAKANNFLTLKAARSNDAEPLWAHLVNSPLDQELEPTYRWRPEKSRRSRVLGTEFRWIDSRSHFRMGKGYSLLPVDILETDRYELYHYIVKHVLGSNCPIANDMTLNRVLDVGTGTGLWALDMAREFPASKIYGCDVAPVIDNSQTRPNIYWGNADLLRGLPYSDNSFDLVHQRQLCVYIGERQWPLVARELYRLCRPGGKLCLIELLPTVTVASDIVSWHDCELSGRVAAVRCINDLIQQTLHKSAMLRRNDGHIVTMASSLGILGAAGLASYCSSKGAAILFHDALHHELDLLGSKVRTSVVCPSHITTNRFSDLGALNTVFQPRITPQQVADVIVAAVDEKRSRDIYMPWLITMLPVIPAMPLWVRDVFKREAGFKSATSHYVNKLEEKPEQV